MTALRITAGALLLAIEAGIIANGVSNYRRGTSTWHVDFAVAVVFAAIVTAVLLGMPAGSPDGHP